jgi:hypothetical protein
VVAVGVLPGLVTVAGIVVGGVLDAAVLAALEPGALGALEPAAGVLDAAVEAPPEALAAAVADGPAVADGGVLVLLEEEADEPLCDEHAVSARAEPRTRTAAVVRVMVSPCRGCRTAPALPGSCPYDADQGHSVVPRRPGGPVWTPGGVGGSGAGSR